MSLPNSKFLFVDAKGTKFVIEGKCGIRAALKAARDSGAQGKLTLKNVESADIERAMRSRGSLASLWKRAKRRGE